MVVERYFPIEFAVYGDIVCIDPANIGMTNDSRWMFLGWAGVGDAMHLMILNTYHWSGTIVTLSAEGFIVVEP